MKVMKRRTTAICVGLLLAFAACGLTEAESSGMLDPTYVNCPMRSELSFEEAASRAELVVHARPTESFFVDHCHRAFLLEVESVWQGILPDPVLAIVRVEPHDHVQLWTDLGLGETAVFLLESDPEVPEAFRPVGSGAVLPVKGGYAQLCQPRFGLGCDVEQIGVRALQAIFDSSAALGPVDKDLLDLDMVTLLDVFDDELEASAEPDHDLETEIDDRIDFADDDLFEADASEI